MALGPWTEYKRKEKEKQVSQTERTTKSNRRVEAGRAIIIHYAERAWDTEKKLFMIKWHFMSGRGISFKESLFTLFIKRFLKINSVISALSTHSY